MNKLNCIQCNREILQVTYDHNAGYCGICYKEEIYKDSLKNTILSEKEACRIAEDHLNKDGENQKANSATYDPLFKDGRVVSAKWLVYFKFETEDGWSMDPEGFFVEVNDKTKEIYIPTIM